VKAQTLPPDTAHVFGESQSKAQEQEVDSLAYVDMACYAIIFRRVRRKAVAFVICEAVSENPVPAVPTTGFEEFWKGGSEPTTLSEKTLCSVGCK
jgi:hypothetical protein